MAGHNTFAITAVVAIALVGGMAAGYLAKPKKTVTEEGAAPGVQHSDALEFKAASIDAGRLLRTDDASVDTMRALVAEVARVYSTRPEKAADMAATASDILKKKGVVVGIAQALDAGLMLCAQSCKEDDLAAHLALYATARESGQTHHQTLRSLLIIETQMKSLQRR